MAERKAAAEASADPDFLQANDLACEAVGGKVSQRDGKTFRVIVSLGARTDR